MSDPISSEIYKASRQRYWHELSLEEKVETLGDRLEYLKRSVDDIAEATEKLLRHIHAEGRIFYAEGNERSQLGWPSQNILNRERPER